MTKKLASPKCLSINEVLSSVAKATFNSVTPHRTSKRFLISHNSRSIKTFFSAITTKRESLTDISNIFKNYGLSDELIQLRNKASEEIAMKYSKELPDIDINALKEIIKSVFVEILYFKILLDS